jgi:hypothetical protein
MEQADGISLENLVRLGTPMMHPNQLLDIMHNLNRTQLIMAAIFDLLTSQCDRHAQVGGGWHVGQMTLLGRLLCIRPSELWYFTACFLALRSNTAS